MQAPVKSQLMVAVYRFGAYGVNAASVGSVARKFGISEGSVINHTYRTIMALHKCAPEHKMAIRI